MNILGIMSGNSGTAWWRLVNFWVAASRTKKCGFHVLGWEKEINQCHPWQVDIAKPEYQAMMFTQLFAAGREADAIVMQRVETKYALSTFYALKDQFPDKPLLAEIDDDIFDVAPYNPAASCIYPGSHLTHLAIDQFKNADGIIVSTPYLKEVYAEYNDNIYVVPNSIDVQKWNTAKRKKRPGIRIGWIGSGSHSEDIELLDKVIDPIIEKNPGVKFVFASWFGEEQAALPKFLRNRKGVKIENKWVPILKYPAYLGSLDFDIGLAPLRDNKFNRCKSNIRWLEYSGFGIPCVASDVGHFHETIRHGVDGLLAKDPEQFIRHINNLIADVKWRKSMGRSAYARIQKDFNVDKNLDIYIEAIKDCLSRPTRGAPSLVTGVDTINEPEMSPLEVINESGNADHSNGAICQ